MRIIPEIITHSPASLEPERRPRAISPRDVAWFSVFILLGGLAVAYPLVALGLLAAVVAVGLGRLAIAYVRRARLEFWQVLALVGLGGYMILNYGFENLTIHAGGLPIIIGYGLMYASVALAVFSCRHLLMSALKEPAWLCLLALIVLTFLHLVFDIPSYGIWAIRDASIFLDGSFLLLGLLWATKKHSVMPLLKGLFVIFLLNLIYAYSYPWHDKILSSSPVSGVFLRVPIFGQYHATAMFLLAGALFCLGIGTYVVGWPRWTILFLAIAQLLGLGIHEYRSMYISIAVVLILLMLLGDRRKSAVLFISVASAFAIIVLVTSLGIKIPARFGDVNAAFFWQHIRSLSGAEGTPGANVSTRVDWYDEVFPKIRAHPVIGVGFGQPLLNDVNNLGVVIRQPHDSHLTVLARLGAIGLAIWLLFHFCIVKKYIHVLRRQRHRDKETFEVVLWLSLFYIILMIVSSVEPGLEFPSGAVPFYFLTGFALGFMRWRVPRGDGIESRRAALVGREAIYQKV